MTELEELRETNLSLLAQLDSIDDMVDAIMCLSSDRCAMANLAEIRKWLWLAMGKDMQPMLDLQEDLLRGGGE